MYVIFHYKVDANCILAHTMLLGLNCLVRIVIYYFCFLHTAKLMLDLEKYDEAEKLYRDLLDRNPENWANYTGLEHAVRPGNLFIYLRTGEICQLIVWNKIHHWNGIILLYVFI